MRAADLQAMQEAAQRQAAVAAPPVSPGAVAVEPAVEVPVIAATPLSAAAAALPHRRSPFAAAMPQAATNPEPGTLRRVDALAPAAAGAASKGVSGSIALPSPAGGIRVHSVSPFALQAAVLAAPTPDQPALALQALSGPADADTPVQQPPK